MSAPAARTPQTFGHSCEGEIPSASADQGLHIEGYAEAAFPPVLQAFPAVIEATHIEAPA